MSPGLTTPSPSVEAARRRQRQGEDRVGEAARALRDGRAAQDEDRRVVVEDRDRRFGVGELAALDVAQRDRQGLVRLVEQVGERIGTQIVALVSTGANGRTPAALV